MRIYKNKQSKELAAKANAQPGKWGESFAESLIKRQIIDDTEENYGRTIHEALNEETPVLEFCKAMEDVGLHNITYKEYTKALGLFLMGDGDCPECGGKMEVTDGEYRTSQFDRDSEPEVDVIWEEMTCNCCGCKIYNGI